MKFKIMFHETNETFYLMVLADDRRWHPLTDMDGGWYRTDPGELNGTICKPLSEIVTRQEFMENIMWGL